MTLRNLTSIGLLATILLTLSNYSQALEGDRDLPITGSADNTSINTATGENILTGNVTIRQGALVIYAEKIIIHRDEADGSITYMKAIGSPAIFKDTPAAGDAEVTVEGMQLEYFPVENRIVTQRAARILQAGNEASGARIDYNTASGVMLISSERETEGTPDGKQAEFIIQPGAVN